MSRREEILRCAGALFGSLGYHATSMRHLAQALGLQGGSLYAHIESKEELLWEIVSRAADEFDLALMQALESGGGPAERLEAALVAHLGVVTRNLDLAAVFFNEWKHLPPERFRAMAVRRDRVEAVYRQILQEGVEAGVFREDLDLALATKLLLAPVNWAYTWFSPQGPRSAEEVGRWFARGLMEGLRVQRT